MAPKTTNKFLQESKNEDATTHLLEAKDDVATVKGAQLSEPNELGSDYFDPRVVNILPKVSIIVRVNRTEDHSIFNVLNWLKIRVEWRSGSIDHLLGNGFQIVRKAELLEFSLQIKEKDKEKYFLSLEKDTHKRLNEKLIEIVTRTKTFRMNEIFTDGYYGNLLTATPLFLLSVWSLIISLNSSSLIESCQSNLGNINKTMDKLVIPAFSSLFTFITMLFLAYHIHQKYVDSQNLRVKTELLTAIDHCRRDFHEIIKDFREDITRHEHQSLPPNSQQANLREEFKSSKDGSVDRNETSSIPAEIQDPMAKRQVSSAQSLGDDMV